MYLDKTRLCVQGQPVNGVSCETDRERERRRGKVEKRKNAIEEYLVYPIQGSIHTIQGSIAEPRFNFLPFSLVHWHLARRVG